MSSNLLLDNENRVGCHMFTRIQDETHSFLVTPSPKRALALPKYKWKSKLKCLQEEALQKCSLQLLRKIELQAVLVI